MTNMASGYGVAVVPATPDAGGWVWRAEVSHVPDSENGGNHNVYVSVFDAAGRDLRGENGPRVLWGWEGQRADEAVPPLVLDKPPGEWGTNFPLFRGQHAWVSVIGRGIPADTVTNLHTGFKTEGPGTSDGHHSYRVAFRLVREAAQPSPVVTPPATPGASVAELMSAAEYLEWLAGVLRAQATAQG